MERALQRDEHVIIATGTRHIVLRDPVHGLTADPYGPGRFTIEMHGGAVRTEHRVFMFNNSWIPFHQFFADLVLDADRSRARRWVSPEHDLTIDAVGDPLGHYQLTFTIQDGATPTWTAMLHRLTVEQREEMRALADRLKEWIYIYSRAAS